MTEMEGQAAQQILQAAQDLSRKVGQLNDQLTVQKKQVAKIEELQGENDEVTHRLKRRSIVFYVIVAVVLAAGAYIVKDKADVLGCVKNWADKNTTRQEALLGPSNSRIHLFFQAYREAAGEHHAPVSAAARARLIAGLDQDRKEFSLIPVHAALEKTPVENLLAYRDLVASLRASNAYEHAVAAHPIPKSPKFACD